MMREITNVYPRMLGANELMRYLSMGKNRAVEFGKECGACKRIGGRVLFDRMIIDRALDNIESEYCFEKKKNLLQPKEIK